MRFSFRQVVALAVMALLATVLTVVPATAQDDSSGEGAEVGEVTVQLIHASDLEGGVEALHRAPNFAAIVERLEADSTADKTVVVSAGDNNIPGPFYNASGDQATFRDGGVFNDAYNTLWAPTDPYDALREGGGRVDISIMNVIGFDATAIGNHEFDLGSDAFESIINWDPRDPAGPPGDRWAGAQFPYLSSNLDFSGDDALSGLFTTDILPYTDFMTGPDQSTAGATDVPKIAQSTLISDGAGGNIGVVGATTPILETISSPTGTVVTGPTTNDMTALAAELQPKVNALIAAGADKVILTSHLQQLALETELVGKLSGVDLVIAGGSDTILANAGDALWPGDTAAGTYPVVTTNKDGDPAAVVSTDGEYKYVGNLTVEFDADGKIIPASIAGGPIATTDANVASLWGTDDPFAAGTNGAIVTDLTDAVEGVVIAKDGNITGNTSVFLEGRRENVRTEETNLGNLSADANLYLAQMECGYQVDFSLKNGGGIRAPIGEVVNVGGTTTFLPPQANPLSGKAEGEISELDISDSLRFNNGLTCVKVDAEGLLALLEHGFAATEDGATPGQFPQLGGLRVSFDPSLTPGDRVRNVTLMADNLAPLEKIVEDGVLMVNRARRFGVVTLGFLADGGDDYPFPAVASNRVDLFDDGIAAGDFTFADPGTEQDAMAEYLGSHFGPDSPYMYAETPPSEDMRIQNLAERSDAVFEGFGTDGADVMVGDGSRNGLNGLAGADKIRGKRNNDILLGSFGRDRLNGDGELDLLLGGGGDDVILGGNGGDIIAGGAGRDRLAGQAGRDPFYVELAADLETIVDFEANRDFLLIGNHWDSAAEFLADGVDKSNRAVWRSPVDDTVLIIRNVSVADLDPDRILQHPSDLP